MLNSSAALIDAFQKLRDLLIEDNDTNWIRGVDQIISVLTNEPKDVRRNNAYEIYSKMLSGKDSFNDYFCWDADPLVLKSRNDRLKQIKREIISEFS